MKRSCSLLLLALLLAQRSPAQAYLTPLDFGLKRLEHGRIDYTHTPPNILVGNFNSDCYPDIARFTGDKLEIYLFSTPGYACRPQLQRTFDQPIKALRLGGSIWSQQRELIVTLADGTEKTFGYGNGTLDLVENQGFNLGSDQLPRRISDFDFQIVWQSEPKPFGFSACTVGDLDNDGIEELATWYKGGEWADTAWILIYKCLGDNEYQLFMEEEFTVELALHPEISRLLISDIDQNGQKELIYTYDKCYFWEFSAPGVYTAWSSDFVFPRAVEGCEITDVDQDGILEIAAITTTPGVQPPTAYIVREFVEKNGQSHTILTSSITGFYQDWEDCRFDVGDFDNDGAVDMVSGNASFVIGYDPVELQYFRYDPTSINPPNFSRNWLVTGIPLRCVTPVVADMDHDGQNELFAGGIFPNGGSAFVWEPTGFQTGYVSWLDTTSSPNGPNESPFGYVDYNPSVLAVHIITEIPTQSRLALWSYQDGFYMYAWQSTIMDSTFYNSPKFSDPDEDDKMSVILADDITHIVADWEQTQAGVFGNPPAQVPQALYLGFNYPNPFNSLTTIPFEIPAPANVQLRIYDIVGNLVYQDGAELLVPGKHAFNWKASGLASGIYLICLQSGNERQIRKGVILK